MTINLLIMLKLTRLAITIAAFLCSNAIIAQLLVVDPPFPTANDQVTIYFDATEGTGGLANCNCNVYLHTGVITSASTGPSDWKYVVTTWGQANAAWQLTPVPGQPNMYSYVIGPSIRQYYGVPQSETILKLAFVFRNATGTLEGKGPGGTDIFYDVYPENLELTVNLTSPAANNFDIALGENINVSAAASQPSQFFIYNNNQLIHQSATGLSQLNYDFQVLDEGFHLVDVIAQSGQQSDTSSFSYTSRYEVDLLSPANPVVLTSLGQNIQVNANAHIASNIKIFDNGVQIAQTPNSATLNHQITVNTGGTHEVVVAAAYGVYTDTTRFVYVVPGNVPLQDPPAVYPDGITLLGDTGLFLQLYAPNKQVVFVIGDFNNWLPGTAYQMNKALDGATYWLEISGLTPGQSYAFQYLVDGAIRIADPYSTVVLDPQHDPFIPEETYPNLPEYPYGKTTGIVSLIQPGAPQYEWQTDDFVAPPKTKLVVYELLLRDFIDRHDYTTLIDTLDYLANLGVSAIELMPVNEFEGNISWGYNPSFHMALDKYYGPINEFKRFVDACHERGIAVILDVVYNHLFSQSALAQLYWDPVAFKPALDNPWLNRDPRHPFNVGYDINHESAATRKYIDRVITYWLTEFRIDGFRFDLSKGFTQNLSTNDSGMSAYDASRIAILKHYADVSWAANPNAYVILEHFAAATEETELNNYGNGMMFWTGAGLHNQYLEASMGYVSNLNGASYKSRGWTQPNVVAYMESHDEERMMYKNLNFGNSSGGYNVRNILTGMKRVELASALFYPIPGPKMLWQFGELGYDFPINYCPNGTIDNGCRTDPKPIRWDYNQSPNRRRIYDVMRALIELKKTHDVFSTSNFVMSVQNMVKTIHLYGTEMDVVVLGNTNVITDNATNPFLQGGWWYEYFTGDSLLVADPTAPLPLAPGEYRLYTTTRLSAPPGGYISADYEPVTNYFSVQITPNPSIGEAFIQFTLPESNWTEVQVFDLAGRAVGAPVRERLQAGPHSLPLPHDLAPGMYLVRLSAGGKAETAKWVMRQ